ncbi:hypothetical protein AVEN_139649-1 [Araneus ventricosus]|uniref:Uncharacterized protein n=1 Tax=Araneus ventricosus TaxID=182803 RepID=A0A4Y2FWP8_ARAVE|nr:hypothetical protein AVEN_139649-1 [Araneus ventricosus]
MATTTIPASYCQFAYFKNLGCGSVWICKPNRLWVYLAVGVQELLIVASVLVSVYNTLMPVYDLSSDGNWQKCERNINESTELHIWRFMVRHYGTFKYETQVIYAALWYIQV